MATLKDIARRMNLSVTQVSRALNDHLDVNAETRDRVKAMARAMNYQPNVSARKLASGRSGMVGLVVPRSAGFASDLLFLEVVAGLSAQFSSRGMQFVLHVMEETEPELPVYQKLIGSGALDGFVLIDPRNADPRIHFLTRAAVPFVVHGRIGPDPEHPFFDIENETIFRDLTELLLQAGHRDIALVNGLADRTYVSARSRGFRAAMAGAGLAVGPDRDLPGEMDEAHGLVSAVRLMSQPWPRPTAIICGNLRIAQGVFRGLEALRLRVPADVSVVAHDDELPGLNPAAFQPGLTVSMAPLRESWKPLADCLAGAIDGLPLADLQRVGPHRMIARASVAPPALPAGADSLAAP